MELAFQPIEGFTNLKEIPNPHYRITEVIALPDSDCSYADYLDIEAKQTALAVYRAMSRFAITEARLMVWTWRENNTNLMVIEMRIQA